MNGISAYQENNVTTQSKGRLIVLLYEGAIKFCRQAITALDDQDFMGKGQAINKAIAILEELNYCLDMEAGGEVAANLRSLYTFMIRHLTQANLRRDVQRIEEVIRLLDELNAGWKAITN